jgi:hypothetical protein
MRKAPVLVVALAAGALVLAAACGSSRTPSAAARFPTGPAVLLPAGYQAPSDHVVSTGAYLPSNGKPTLVFVDAVW